MSEAMGGASKKKSRGHPTHPRDLKQKLKKKIFKPALNQSPPASCQNELNLKSKNTAQL